MAECGAQVSNIDGSHRDRRVPCACDRWKLWGNLDRLTDESEVLPEHGGGNVEGKPAEDDGPEFSSSPMPAAYGVFYSAAIGLLTLVIMLAIFRAIF